MVAVYIALQLNSDNHQGAASDKVVALSKAGVIVTDSPAKIGAEMLKVRNFVVCAIFILIESISCAGYESSWAGVDTS